MKRLVLAIMMTAVMGFTTMATADTPYPGTPNLYDRGRGLIYDADLNITWFQDAGFGGQRTWFDAMDWVSDLVYWGYDDWRLPTTPGTAYGITSEGEMGHLHYTELGNTGSDLTKPGPFTNLPPFSHALTYWTDKEYSLNTDDAWVFYFDGGGQSRVDKDVTFYAWAVRDGDVPQVPEPATILLLGLGLIGSVGVRRKFSN